MSYVGSFLWSVSDFSGVHNCTRTHRPAMSLGYFALFLFVVSNTQAALFETLDHSVEGEVKIEGHTIVVENFSYNGTAPDAFFYVGTGGCPSGSRTLQLGRHSRQRNPVRGSSWSCPTTSEQVIWPGVFAVSTSMLCRWRDLRFRLVQVVRCWLWACLPVTHTGGELSQWGFRKCIVR